ncbi:MAG: hypothetical protein KC776_43305 [Myxococcales bacterium]|nr:hypothetical protein [Myxococcales bacterium]MCB9582318.1 hypothetical protein [Polyangiaceae bacterium]
MAWSTPTPSGSPAFQALPDAHSDFVFSVSGSPWLAVLLVVVVAGIVVVVVLVRGRRAR